MAYSRTEYVNSSSCYVYEGNKYNVRFGGEYLPLACEIVRLEDGATCFMETDSYEFMSYVHNRANKVFPFRGVNSFEEWLDAYCEPYDSVMEVF